jgi:hypothetical protein
MIKKFFVEADPSDSNCDMLAELQPTIPYYTSQYKIAIQESGKKVYLIGVEADGKLLFGCLAEMHSGRISRELGIQSTPGDADHYFWDGMREFCKSQKITHLYLGTVGTAPQIPQLGEILAEKGRSEYWVDLKVDNLKKLMKGEQRRIYNRGIEAGLEVRQVSSDEALETHRQLARFSLDRRRHRGESIPMYSRTAMMEALINSGVGRVYECILNDVVLGSVIITISKSGVHGYSAGYSAEGLKAGAGVFLNHTTFNILKDEGKVLFNLGDAPPGSGLAHFKKSVGGVPMPSRSIKFYTGNLVHKLTLNIASSLRKTINQFRA